MADTTSRNCPSLADLKTLVQRFENTCANYWAKDGDERVSDKRLRELDDAMRARKADLLAAIESIVTPSENGNTANVEENGAKGPARVTSSTLVDGTDDKHDEARLKRWQRIADQRAIQVADLQHHLRRAIAFITSTEAFGKMAESGILQAGEDRSTAFNVDEAKKVLAGDSAKSNPSATLPTGGEALRRIVEGVREFYLGYLSKRLTFAEFDGARSDTATNTAEEAILKHALAFAEAIKAESNRSATREMYPRLLVRNDVVWLQIAEHDLVNSEALAAGNLSQKARQAVVNACRVFRSDSSTKP